MYFNNMKFSIESVYKMTGIPPATLRNWEKRYGFPHPQRSAGGHRFYNQSDIEFLKKATCWIEQGQGLPEIAKLYQKQICPSVVEAQIKNEIVDDVSFRTELIYESLVNFDQNSFLQHYTVLNVKLGPEQLFTLVFEKILKRLGKEWAEGKISIAQEHFVSAFIRMKLGSFLAMDFPATQDKRILAATCSDERHEGGLMLLSAHLKFKGYPLFYFGTDVPVESLQKVVDDIKPQVVCLSYSHIERVKADLKYLKKLSVPSCLGGGALFHPHADAVIKEASDNIFFCKKTQGKEAAEFVEMICCHK